MKPNKIAAWIVIALAAFLTLLNTGSVFLAFLVAFVLSALLTPIRLAGTARANTVDAELNLNVILDSALTAFKRSIIALTMFATTFRDIVLKGTNKVEVPYYPLETSASRDFDTCYVFDDDYAVDKREVTINKRKYQPLLITGTELSRFPQINLEKIGQQKGEKLAYDIIQDVLSLVTNANFGAAAFTGAASTFDGDDVEDLAVVADLIPWPKAGRGMLVTPAYKGNLFKDGDVALEYAYGSPGVIRDDVLPRVRGFEFDWSPAIPANGENLVGFISYMSAILVGFSPIEPPPAARKLMTRYDVVTDPETGISLEYREWGDPDCDADKRTIEANYGYAKGEANALKRMISA